MCIEQYVRQKQSVPAPRGICRRRGPQSRKRTLIFASNSLFFISCKSKGLSEVKLGDQGSRTPQSLAHLVILCFERPCSEQNIVARLKSKFSSPKILGWLRNCLKLRYSAAQDKVPCAHLCCKLHSPESTYKRENKALASRPPLRCYAHKFSLFLVKTLLSTHTMCYEADHKRVLCFQRSPTKAVVCKYFAFKGPPTATEMCKYVAFKPH